MSMKKMKRILACFLSAAMVLAGSTIAAWAETGTMEVPLKISVSPEMAKLGDRVTTTVASASNAERSWDITKPILEKTEDSTGSSQEWKAVKVGTADITCDTSKKEYTVEPPTGKIVTSPAEIALGERFTIDVEISNINGEPEDFGIETKIVSVSPGIIAIDDSNEYVIYDDNGMDLEVTAEITYPSVNENSGTKKLKSSLGWYFDGEDETIELEPNDQTGVTVTLDSRIKEILNYGLQAKSDYKLNFDYSGDLILQVDMDNPETMTVKPVPGVKDRRAWIYISTPGNVLLCEYTVNIGNVPESSGANNRITMYPRESVQLELPEKWKNENITWKVRSSRSSGEVSQQAGGIRNTGSSLMISDEIEKNIVDNIESIPSDVEQEEVIEHVYNILNEMGSNAAVKDSEVRGLGDVTKKLSETLQEGQSAAVYVKSELKDMEVRVITRGEGDDMEVLVIPERLVFDAGAFMSVYNEDGTVDTEDGKINNNQLTGESFTFRLPIPSSVDTKYVKVIHVAEDGSSDVYYERIQIQNGSKYIEVTVKHFSDFIVTFEDSIPGSEDSTAGGSSHGYSKPWIPASTADKNSGSWVCDSKGWWYRFGDGTWPTNSWLEQVWGVSKNWYYFNAEGYKVTGWYKIGDKWYYFNPESGGPMGAMLSNATTPDGYYVGADGAWVEK